MTSRVFSRESFERACALTAEHSPYLRSLLERRPETVRQLSETSPATLCESIGEQVITTAQTAAIADLDRGLRLAKADIHLICALADIAALWTLETVTKRLTQFADAAMQAALLGAARALQERGLIETISHDTSSGPLPGLFVVAMGKYGAGELNYSSDIDFTLFFDPHIAQDWLGKNPARTTSRLVRQLVRSLGNVNEDGYVFRPDLRLRPDPGSTNPVVSTTGAHIYYETVGQNWERAALIKARICAGDTQAGNTFLKDLHPFIWRRSLDFDAIEDIHAMKRQIHISLEHDAFLPAGHNVKLGRGGIREIEFFTQTQQLILGGRDPALRSPQTCLALHALAKAGHIDKQTAIDLTRHYQILRRAEHGAQMLADQQTHTLPTKTHKRAALAALMGYQDLPTFDAELQATFKRVHTIYSALFPQAKPLSTRSGSLVFTGVEDDPATMETLQNKGFTDPHIFLERMRAWHSGQIRATRSGRARALLTRLGPQLVNALAKTGDPDHAFAVFTRFFENLNTGVQPLSLLCSRQEVLDLLVAILNTAPRLSFAFSNRVSTLDAMVDPGFATPLEADTKAGAKRLLACAEDGVDFETLLNAIRRTVQEERLRTGVQVLTNKTSMAAAAQSYTALADAAIAMLSKACAGQMIDRFGPVPGEWVVLGLGSLGAQTMNDGSDLDLFTLYLPHDSGDAQAGKYFTRFIQRLINALSAQTAEGGLYTIDMKLRPSGKAGPVAVKWPAFVSYYQDEAWTWEILALGRARIIASSSTAFAKTVSTYIDKLITQPRNLDMMTRDVGEMLQLLRKEYPQPSPWMLKETTGGLIETGLLRQLIRYREVQPPTPDQPYSAYSATLDDAQALQSSLLQILRLCLPAALIAPPFPVPVQHLLARRNNAQNFEALELKLITAQQNVHRIAEQILM
jgi:[glutamine synthetase] adenylyltransferase / [glutamine synthetase]-adenylyl-L-tyrosine phosphorylase